MLGTFHRDDYPPNRFADPDDEGWMEKYNYHKRVEDITELEIEEFITIRSSDVNHLVHYYMPSEDPKLINSK